MHPYAKEGEEYARCLAACSDEELVAKHNGQVRLRCFGLGRAMSMRCLMEEILSRDFDSEVLFKRDENGKISSYRTGFRVGLKKEQGSSFLVIEDEIGRPCNLGECYCT